MLGWDRIRHDMVWYGIVTTYTSSKLSSYSVVVFAVAFVLVVPVGVVGVALFLAGDLPLFLSPSDAALSLLMGGAGVPLFFLLSFALLRSTTTRSNAVITSSSKCNTAKRCSREL